MSPLDLLRRALPETAPSTQGRGASLARAAVQGAVAGLITLLPILIIGSGLWLTTADLPLSWAEAMLAATAFWLLGHGIPIVLSGGVIGIVPLAMFFLVLWIGVWLAGRATWSAAAHGWRAAIPTASAWAGGYAALLVVTGALTLLGPIQPDRLRWIAATLLLPPVMAAIGMVRSLDHDEVDEFLDRLWVPAAVRRGWRPAVHTSVVVVASGALAAVVAVVLSFGDIWALQQDLRPGVAGGAILLLLQLLAIPNIGLWIASFVAGPGFSVIDGASVTWDGSTTALVPMIPVFAAHPHATEFPTLTPLVAVSLVILGGWLGWQCLAATARLASLRAKGVTIVSASISTGFIVGLLNWVGGGSLGVDRLAHVGAPSVFLGLAVTGWLLLGAGLVLLWDWRTLDA